MRIIVLKHGVLCSKLEDITAEKSYKRQDIPLLLRCLNNNVRNCNVPRKLETLLGFYFITDYFH